MGVVELPPKEQQLSFVAFDLAAAVASLLKTEAEKHDIVEEYNGRIKLLKKRIAKLSAEVEAQQAPR